MIVQILKGEHKGKIGRVLNGFPVTGEMTYSVVIEDGDNKSYVSVQDSNVEKMPNSAL